MPLSKEEAVLAHDIFNIACISIMNLLNFLNWKHDWASWSTFSFTAGPEVWRTLWEGTFQKTLLNGSITYYVVDALFVGLLPHCVKSPITIFGHHVAVMVALLVPFLHPSTHGFHLGLWLLVDFNTIFLITRRVLMEFPKSPLLRVMRAINSTLFYITWVLTRLLLYPIAFFTVAVVEWKAGWNSTGTPVNVFLIIPIIAFMLVCLNIQWTWNLYKSLRKRLFMPPDKKAENKFL